ncbi:cytochrome c oxidase assembly factor 3, mitochondrial [Diabrotica undecimpunctata]|uniref:cytochrome c oxidase assembly factor 3, mitochondrial n=1 Tax=Diabrotica undecimpunctata TaxID=50387 RepID=UPI003B631C28
MSDRMPKIDLSKIKKTDLDFIKQIEKQNQERVLKLKKLRRTNLLTAGFLTAGIISIYGYSMYAVRQESFLDDFDEPAKTTQ